MALKAPQSDLPVSYILQSFLLILSVRRLDPWGKGEEPEGEGTSPHANQGTGVHVFNTFIWILDKMDLAVVGYGQAAIMHVD